MTNAINPPYVPKNPLNNNTYGALNPEKITGYITVSSKGTSNGLSDIPNDGAMFGPDTLGTKNSARKNSSRRQG